MAKITQLVSVESRKRFKLTLWRSQTGWRWRLKAKNGRVLAASTEAYTQKYKALLNIHDATGFDVRGYGTFQRGEWTVARNKLGAGIESPTSVSWA